MPSDNIARNFWKRCIYGSLLLFFTGIAISIFSLSLRIYTTSYRTTRAQHRANDMLFHTLLFICTCAPICTIIGFTTGALHYLRRRSKHGIYNVRMRRQGRGYWIDPTDAEDKSKESQAKTWNEYLNGRTRLPRKLNLPVPVPVPVVQKEPVSPPNTSPLHTNNPTAARPPSRLATITEIPEPPIIPEETASHLDSRSCPLRTCDNDETTKMGVQRIWLQGRWGESSVGKGYDGREKRRENWEGEGNGVIGRGWGWWGDGKGKGRGIYGGAM